jgi:hypothetical protein
MSVGLGLRGVPQPGGLRTASSGAGTRGSTTSSSGGSAATGK